MRIDFEPFKPINTSLYMCDNKFHTAALSDLLVNDQKYGFVVMDGNGTLFGTLCGNHREVLQKISVDLPKKHGRGGQSALRFARLRLEKRQNYLTKVAELTTQHFITNDKPNVAGLVLAGSADFKNKLAEADCFDNRLQEVTLAVVDVSYGGENGFNQAIELSADTLSSLKFIAEKKLVGKFFDEIAQDTGKYVFGINDTLACLEMGAVETLVAWEDLEVKRVTLKNPTTEEEIVKHLRQEEIKTATTNTFATRKATIWRLSILSRSSSGWPPSTKSLVAFSSLSRTSRKKETSFAEALEASAVCCDTKSISPRSKSPPTPTPTTGTPMTPNASFNFSR